MDDLIRREDAINEAYYIAIGGEILEVVQVETLLGLPSAEADLSEYSDKLWQRAYERGKAEAEFIYKENEETKIS